MRTPRLTVVTCGFLNACLPSNPEPGAEGSTSGETTSSEPAPDNLLGCPDAQACWVAFAAQTLDDRVEIFGGEAGQNPTYRGAIDLDLKPGTDLGPLDEPFGMALSEVGLHVVTGHYPKRELGALLTFPRAFFDDRGPAEIPLDDYFAGGAFSNGVTETRLDELEPIFALANLVQGRLLISVFANDLFAAEDTWNVPGRLAVLDPSSPQGFAMTTLSGLDGGDCLGASQLTLLENDRSAAVACDGNEAVAFLDLGDLTAPPVDGAAAITGRLCNLPFMNNRRARYLAHDGAGGVLIGLGPTPLNPSSSQVYSVSADCTLSPLDVAENDAHLGELVRFGDGHWLLAQGAISPAGERGVKVINTTGVCGTVSGLEEAWTTAGDPIAPFALAVTTDRQNLALGAGPTQVGNSTNSIYGKVLWASLSGIEDPCTMSAEVTDLTDGSFGHAPAPEPADESTWRRGPNVLIVEEVAGQ